MRAIALFFGVLALGCSGKVGPADAKLDSGGKSTPDAKASRAAAFNANDSTETGDWLRAKVSEIEAARRSQNELAQREAFTAFNTEMRSRVGARVSWRVSVSNVTGKAVRLSPEVLSTPGEVRTRFVVTATDAATLTGELARTYDGEDFGSVPVGTVIPTRVAASLKTRDTILVTGTLSRFNLDGYSEELFCNAIITNAKAEK